MKRISILFIFSLCALTSLGQTANAKKAYGQNLFKHFVFHDFDILVEQVAVRYNTIRFRENLKEIHKRGQEEYNIIWNEVSIDDITIVQNALGNYSGIQILFVWDAVPYSWQIHDIQFLQKEKKYKILTPIVSLRTAYPLLNK